MKFCKLQERVNPNKYSKNVIIKKEINNSKILKREKMEMKI